MPSKKQTIPDVNFSADKNWIEYFLNYDISFFEREMRTKSEDFWIKKGEEKALDIFHEAALKVPAYKDFLKKNKIDHKRIKTIKDFEKVPVTDKQNYIKKYSLKERSWNGKLDGSRLMAMSSGTSGEPTFWPRSEFQEYESALIHEMMFKYSFGMDKTKTLVVIGFPMGVYVSGMATVLPTWINLSKGYKATFVSPGNNRNEVLRIIKYLWGDYEQILLIGHPFFLKDVVETGKKEGIKWGTKKIKMFFCSEGFNETWRDHILSEAGIKDKASAISTYGSSETLLMAQETPFSISLRRALDKNKVLRSKIVGSEVVPSLFQYNPLLRYIESVNNELVFTVASQTPLVRFNLHDNGHILTLKEIKKNCGNEFKKILDTGSLGLKAGKGHIWNMPIVALFGRSDHTLKFYAANIYPEHIRIALDHKPFLEKLTGKFAMQKREKEDLEQYLEINIELKAGLRPDEKFADEVKKMIYEKLQEINKEFLCICKEYDKDLRPIIQLWENGHEKYFKPGLKPRFIIKE